MKSKSFLYIIALIAAIMHGCASACGSTPTEKENDLLLQKLDSIIANQTALVRDKEVRISGLRQALAKANDSRERLGLSKQLYDEYIVFDSDSALYYAIMARGLTAKVMPDNYDEQTRWKLNEAFIYTVQGLYDTTMDLLKGIDSSRLSDGMKSMLYGSLSYIYSMRSVYLLPNREMSRKDLAVANQYRDSIQAMNLPESHELLWVPIAASIDRDGVDISSLDVAQLKKKVDESTGASRDNAINAYWLSRYYEALGDNDSMVRYKTKAAINDALIVNREIAAIQELATYLFGKGDLNRAYNYLIYTVEQANLYHNRYRMVNLSDVLPTVRDAYREELEKRDHRLSSYVLVLGILSIILIASIIFIVIEFRMGEIGHNTDEWQADFVKVMKDNNIGYTFWPYKKEGGSCMMGITLPDGWEEVKRFAESPHHTFAEIREAKPDRAKAQAALDRFLEQCKARNCTPQLSYIESIGLSMPK